ncbi:protein-L-isoaspartate(D-aspartate) O-methyltransferase [Streptomyces sp. NPDC006784]|uniref:protein-L-isoaspartate(D-aspartate) O-methyltransferase n=1 Tax=Streptomyces sp. NPDC006784 TaxID=3364764 RepID=UPI0036AA19B6
MTIAADHSEQLRHRLVDQLVDRGYLHDSRWIAAFRAVPREAFVTRYKVLSPDGTHQHHDLADPEHLDDALAVAYSDAPLITQTDACGTPTSSSTAPSLMALMLEALQAEPGMRVLEIGTGTGYNAALLSHALGAEAVTTVDIDPALTAAAEEALHRVGYRPTVAGRVAGHRERGPYDRLIATCGVARVPTAWLEQLRPGGLVLVNIGFGLVRLTVGADGTATGRFLDYASFMQAREDTATQAATARDALALTDRSAPRTDAVFPDCLDERPFVFLRSVMMPGVHQVVEHLPDGPEYVLADHASGSWTRARRCGRGAAVAQGGPRRLWDELCKVAASWSAHHRPPLSSYGLTVYPDGRHVLWLGSPDGPSWPLSG